MGQNQPGPVRRFGAAQPFFSLASESDSDMTPSIRIDEATGQKRFNTRAAKATERIAGKGYSAISDASLKVLPDAPAGAVFNAQEQARYREFKEARRGAADYIAMEGEFSN
ncbi:MAG: hypothetical protein NTV17_05230 [Burkholderiales bacterium]|nr:hypothetical protein [Burkholderiales bacterium]